MNSEPKKPIKADELTEKELEGIAGGVKELKDINGWVFSPAEIKSADFLIDEQFDFIRKFY